MGMPAGFLILPWELGWMCRAGGNTPGNCPSAGSGAGPGNADLLQFPKDGISGIQGLVPGVWEWEIIPRLDNGQLINNSSASQLSAPSPHPRAPKSSSYLFLLWREAFLGDPLSFVEFLPSPAWKTPVLGAERKSHLSFYGPGLCASQEPGSDQ